MHLKLPKTVEWFQKNAKYLSYVPELNANVKETESYEFYKYHSLNPWTQPNLVTIMYNNEN
jgi:hypothetical protein